MRFNVLFSRKNFKILIILIKKSIYLYWTQSNNHEKLVFIKWVLYSVMSNRIDITADKHIRTALSLVLVFSFSTFG